LILMALAILYGAYSLVAEKGGKAGGSSQDMEIQAANAAAITAAASLAAPPEEKANAYIIARADSAWALDPFFKEAPLSDQPSQAEDEQAAQKMMESTVNLVYTGYITAGGRMLAIINGIEYEPGERITESGLTLVSIARNHVVIGKEGSSVRRVLTLEQTDF